MSCEPAPACRAALDQATALWPNRSRISDGICSSAAHQAQSPGSDHDTGDAWDLTDDPINGCDAHAEVRRIVKRHDPRVKYAISNREIARSYDKTYTDREMAQYPHPRRFVPAWEWDPYFGTNPHTKHAHVSIVSGARNITAPWFSEVSMSDKPVYESGSDVAGIAYTPTGLGYVIVTVKGEVFNFGDSEYFGRVVAP